MLVEQNEHTTVGDSTREAGQGDTIGVTRKKRKHVLPRLTKNRPPTHPVSIGVDIYRDAALFICH